MRTDLCITVLEARRKESRERKEQTFHTLNIPEHFVLNHTNISTVSRAAVEKLLRGRECSVLSDFEYKDAIWRWN